jgi:hypothetical protein
MVEDLGEVRVRIEEEGAQDAADTIGDAVGEGAEGEGGVGGGEGGGIAGALGGISGKLAAILGLVAFLASLKPIQEILSGLQRLFSVAILPLVALLTTFLRPILQKLLRFIGSLDFNNLFQDLSNRFQQALTELGDIIVRSLSDAVFGGNQASTSEQRRTGALLGGAVGSTVAPGTGTLFGPRIGEELVANSDLRNGLGRLQKPLAQQSTGPLGVLNTFNELSSTTVDALTSNKASIENQKNTAGSGP